MKYVPTKPVLRSPVLTSVQRWSGKVPTAPDSMVNAAAEQVDLCRNPFAMALASASRLDRINRLIKIPRAFLLRFSLVRGPESRIHAVPNVTGFRSRASDSYITNSLPVLQRAKWRSFASMEIMTNIYNLTSAADITYDDKSYLLVNVLYLKELDRLVSKMKQQSVDGAGVRVVCEEGKDYNFQNDDLLINLGNVALANERLDELKERLVGLKLSYDDYELISLLMRFVAYNTSIR